MRTLYHQVLAPSCRAVRIMLGEKRLECQLENAENEQETPVLIEENQALISNALVIAEYLNETYPDPDLFGHEPLVRVDVRRIGHYIVHDIDRAVTQPLLQNKLYGNLRGTMASPNAIASARVALTSFMQYLAMLDDTNNWLAGPSFSVVDIFAAAHISTLDFIGAIDWEQHIAVQRWYRRVKSRRSLTGVLRDIVDGIDPPKHYADPDF